jgi:lysophospholipase L1-like esterase
MKRMAALGDSYVAGVDGHDRHGVWVRLVAEQLGRRGDGVHLHTYARHGAKSDDVVADQLPALRADGADLVAVVCGANDVLRHVDPDLERFADNFAQVLDAAADAGEDVVTTTYPDFSPFLPYRPLSKARVVDGMVAVNVCIRQLAAERDVLCVDVERGLPPDAALFAADGIHLSPVGHRRTAGLVLAAIDDAEPQSVAAEAEPPGLIEELLRQWW